MTVLRAAKARDGSAQFRVFDDSQQREIELGVHRLPLCGLLLRPRHNAATALYPFFLELLQGHILRVFHLTVCIEPLDLESLAEAIDAPTLAIQRHIAALAVPVDKALADADSIFRYKLFLCRLGHSVRSSAFNFSKIASIMYACQDGFTVRFSHARSMRSLMASFRRSWKFLVLACWGSSCVATLPPFSMSALIAASLGCCGFDRIGIFLPC